MYAVQVYHTGIPYRYIIRVYRTGIYYRYIVQVYCTGVSYRYIVDDLLNTNPGLTNCAWHCDFCCWHPTWDWWLTTPCDLVIVAIDIFITWQLHDVTRIWPLFMSKFFRNVETRINSFCPGRNLAPIISLSSPSTADAGWPCVHRGSTQSPWPVGSGCRLK